MSLISDALNKAQQHRAEQIAFGTYAAGAYSRRQKPVVQVKSVKFIWANVAILTLFFTVALLYMRNRPYRADTATPAPAVTMAAATKPSPVASAYQPAGDSTFKSLPDSSPIAPVKMTSNEYDLAGMTMMGQKTLLSVSRRSDKRSVWVPVGKSVGEITAVSYDAEQDRAVIRVNGRLLTIGMHDSAAAE